MCRYSARSIYTEQSNRLAIHDFATHVVGQSSVHSVEKLCTGVKHGSWRHCFQIQSYMSTGDTLPPMEISTTRTNESTVSEAQVLMAIQLSTGPPPSGLWTGRRYISIIIEVFTTLLLAKQGLPCHHTDKLHTTDSSSPPLPSKLSLSLAKGACFLDQFLPPHTN